MHKVIVLCCVGVSVVMLCLIALTVALSGIHPTDLVPEPAPSSGVARPPVVAGATELESEAAGERSSIARPAADDHDEPIFTAREAWKLAEQQSHTEWSLKCDAERRCREEHEIAEALRRELEECKADEWEPYGKFFYFVGVKDFTIYDCCKIRQVLERIPVEITKPEAEWIVSHWAEDGLEDSGRGRWRLGLLRRASWSQADRRCRPWRSVQDQPPPIAVLDRGVRAPLRKPPRRLEPRRGSWEGRPPPGALPGTPTDRVAPPPPPPARLARSPRASPPRPRPGGRPRSPGAPLAPPARPSACLEAT